MITKKIGNNIEKLYSSEKEFSDDGNAAYHNNWREAPEGSYAKTDDGQILRILKKSKFKDGKEYIRTILGSHKISDKALIGGKPPKNIYSFAKNKFCNEQRMDREEPNSKEVVFAKYVAHGMPPEDAYMRVFPTNNRDYAKNVSNALFKTERIRTLISEEAKAMLDKVGIDEEYLLNNTKHIIDNDGGRDSDRLRAIEMLMKIAGMFPNDKKTESLTVFQGFTQDQLKQLGDADVKMLGHAEKDIAQ
jgi:hypothetical protein